MAKKKPKSHKTGRCRHPWCVKGAGHTPPHKNKGGSTWTLMTCVNPECGGPCLEFGELLQGHWTPCCRNIRWWNADGTLGGSKDETLFCAVCRRAVCRTGIEPILRKEARPLEVVHDHCRSDDSWVTLEARQWLHSAAYDIAAMASTVATRGLEKGKATEDVREAFRKVIRYLDSRLKDEPSLDMTKLSCDVVLGRTGEFGIQPYEERAVAGRTK